MSRPDFLVVAETAAVLHELRVHDAAGDAVTKAYQRTGWLLEGLTPGERAAYLELAVREIGDMEAAEEIALLPLHRPWRPLWGRSCGTALDRSSAPMPVEWSTC